MTSISARKINVLIFSGCSLLILTALFFQHVVGLEPCPLCMMQRVMVIAIGLIALVAALHDPKSLGLKIYSSMTLVFALGGMALSGRQLWLQSLPADRVPACGPGIDYMLDVFPILKVIEMSIRGTGDCAEVQWTFLGVSIPGWTLLVFIIIAGLSIWQWRKSRAAVIH